MLHPIRKFVPRSLGRALGTAVALALVLGTLPVAALEDETAPSQTAPSQTVPSQTLSGTYMSQFQDAPEHLRAVFTETEETGEWTVVFYFKFNGKNHEYAGTASGSLSEGPLQGTVHNESGRRSFTFDGDVAEGTFRGETAETTRGRRRDTGTLILGS